MRDHLADYLPMYVISGLIIALIIVSFNVNAEQNRRANYCYDRGSVLVDTDAGQRCAPLYSLEKVR